MPDVDLYAYVYASASRRTFWTLLHIHTPSTRRVFHRCELSGDFSLHNPLQKTLCRSQRHTCMDGHRCESAGAPVKHMQHRTATTLWTAPSRMTDCNIVSVGGQKAQFWKCRPWNICCVAKQQYLSNISKSNILQINQPSCIICFWIKTKGNNILSVIVLSHVGLFEFTDGSSENRINILQIHM